MALLSVLLLGLAPAPAAAQGGGAALTPEEARNALSVLGDDSRRQAVIDTLRALAATAPDAAPAAAPATSAPATSAPATRATAAPARATSAPAASAPATPAPAAAPASPGGAAPAEPVSLTSDSLLAEIVAALSEWLSALSTQLAAVGAAFSSIPLIWNWLVRTAANPFAQSALLDIAWRLAVIFALAWAARWVLRRALRRPRAALERRAEAGAERQREERVAQEAAQAAGTAAPRIATAADLRLMQRAPLAALWLVLELIPIGAFALVGNLLLATPLGDGGVTPMVILAAVNAFVAQHVVMAVGCAVFSPCSRRLRLVRVSDETAAYAEVWLGRVSGVAIYGMAVLEVARLLGLYPAAYLAAAKLVILLNHVLLSIVILQCRRGVAVRIAPAAGTGGALGVARSWLARVWHILAIFLLAALWFVWALQIQNGYGLLLRYLGSTVVVIVVARLAAVALLGLLDRVFRIRAETTQRLPLLEGRANRYVPLMRRGISGLIGVVAALALLQLWGLDVAASFQEGRLGHRIAGSVIVLLVAGLLAAVIWEGVNAWIDRTIAEMSARGERARSARLRTLLPLLHTTLLVLIVAIVGFTALSQLGVNIAPLLAGAGILGVAVGFGSQKLVQDVITGIFLLLENTMQVGDWVTVSGLSGTVENLSIRTIRLRAGDGSVHVIPFSSVTTVTNTNRGIGNAAVSVTVAFSEDPDRVGQALKEIGAGLRADPAFSGQILDDFALWGVDKVDGATFTVLGQMPCTDTGRWGVQREFNRRIRQRFAELGIAIAVPAQSVILSRFARSPAEAESMGAGREGPEQAALPEPSGAARNSPPPAALGNTQ